MRILITGARGQLGTELRHLLDEKNIDYIATGSKELDITNPEAVNEYFHRYKPELVYHCAAYTAVDSAEEEPGKTINQDVNVKGTRNIANAAENIGAILVYISTDYVFDGNNSGMYTERSLTNPQNEYGRAKSAGENIVIETMTKYYIIRTSWVFGKYGKNFVFTMLNLSKKHKQLKVVKDQMGRPTWTKTLAEFMNYVVKNEVPYGLYQLSNEDFCTWYEFAKYILKDTNTEVIPVTSAEYPQKAYRPKHSVMDLSKAKNTGFKIISWEDAIDKFMEQL